MDHLLFWEPDGQFQRLIADYITPRGMLFLFDPYQKQEITKAEIDQSNIYLRKLLKNDMRFVENNAGKHLIANKINYIANFWSKLQNKNEVLRSYDAAIKVSPQGERINNNYGMYLMSQGYMSKAAKHLKISYDISPYHLTIYKNLSNLMLRIKNYHASLYFLKDAMKLAKKKDEDINALLGAVHSELAHYDDSIRFLELSSEIIESQLVNHTTSTNYEKKLRWIKFYREFSFEGMMKRF